MDYDNKKVQPSDGLIRDIEIAQPRLKVLVLKSIELKIRLKMNGLTAIFNRGLVVFLKVKNEI